MRKTAPQKSYLPLIVKTVISLFVIIYPMLISIYVFLPLFIGIMGYLLILGIHRGRKDYILFSVIYFINLEINLSLPFFLTLITALIVYILFFHTLLLIRKCKICASLVTVLLLDFFYLGAILAYDFIFQSSTIVLDNILLYSLVIDLLVAGIL